MVLARQSCAFALRICPRFVPNALRMAARSALSGPALIPDAAAPQSLLRSAARSIRSAVRLGGFSSRTRSATLMACCTRCVVVVVE